DIPTDQSCTRFIAPPRQLTDTERALLLFMLSTPIPGRDSLLDQIEQVRVWGECSCGCGTLDLLVLDRPEGLRRDGRTIVSRARNLERRDAPVEVQLHTVDGVLRELEIVWHVPQPALVADPARVRPSNLTSTN